MTKRRVAVVLLASKSTAWQRTHFFASIALIGASLISFSVSQKVMLLVLA
jgi:hypothetical protein